MNGKVLLTDDEKCNGCLLCAVVCSLVHTGEIDLERSHIKVWGADEERFAPLTCHHCETPSCVLACPTKACYQDKQTLRVLIDKKKCIGCQTCVLACPFGHAHYDKVARISTKCDYCDGDPECVRICEKKAISYVYSDESSQARKRESALVRTALKLGKV